MAFLRKLFGGGGEQAPAGDDGFYFYCKCNNCGMPVRVRVNLANDLAADYGDTAAEGYALFKEVMDDRCFRIMRVEIQFDQRRREQSRTVEGGAFITAEEYEAARGQKG